MTSDELDKVRLDKWLWAARFFKTRAIAATAIETGKVEVNGERAKRAKQLQVGDSLRIRLGPYHHIVTVRGLSEIRGPAPVAAKLYEETAESIKAREAMAAQLKAAATGASYEKGRPTKKDRRDIERLRRESRF
ncbi:MAG TPA: S4 domain-containing protein [Gemmatimonadaceae bacterium]|jgi:ribosome-associated heat shock protein Hsp15|nr:S4 domain-containing protein [Gemmatimonadaceae bacterium]